MADFDKQYQRPGTGWRFVNGGTNTKDVPDALPPDKYQAVKNMRSTGDQSMRTRPGYELMFTCNSAPITDLRSYTTLGNNSYPLILARDSVGRVYLGNANNHQVGALAGSTGYGASMVPFRPRESALPWMYIASYGDYRKYSAPDANNNVIQAKVGIAEPQNQVDAQTQVPNFSTLGITYNESAAGWPSSGNNTSNTSYSIRGWDTTDRILADPIVPTRQSLTLFHNGTLMQGFGIGQLLGFDNNSFSGENNINPQFYTPVEDIIPSVGNGIQVPIQAMRYASGNNGNCTLYLGRLPFETNTSNVTPSLRRGAIFTINDANNTPIAECLVYDTIVGANGIVAVETSSSIPTASAVSFQPVTTIVVNCNNNLLAHNGWNFVTPSMRANYNSGISYMSHNMANSNAFANVNGQVPSQDDYIHLSVSLSNPTLLTQMLLMFYLDNPPFNNNTANILYYAVRPADLVQVVGGNQTQLSAVLDAAEAQLIGTLPTGENLQVPFQSSTGNNQWGELLLPISGLSRIGSDLTKSLATCQGFQVQLNFAGNTSFALSSFWVGAGSPPDVGNNGSEYKYQCVPWNTNTGVPGNPTPLMKYGVNPRRQSVLVKTSALDNSYDPQINAWQVYRRGGSLTSYRFIGSVPAGNDFIDTYFDDSAAAGDEVVLDNTEPWPTIDQPWNLVTGGGNAAVAYGQYLEVVSAAALPATMNRWLPGTRFIVGAQDAFTLRSRPQVANNNTAVVFEFQEVIGAGSQSRVSVLEPNVACQPFPYVWGPDAQGFFFGAGDVYRPSCVSWSKGYAPDAVPSGFNRELAPPTEPIMGGEVMGGVSYVASSARWWILNFQQTGNDAGYIPVEVQVGRPLVVKFGLTTDHKAIYYWAQDCIAATTGDGSISLTDTDLYNLFPHGDTEGVDVTRAGVTFYAPDYSHAGQFRIAYRNGVLYAIYVDRTNSQRVLVGERVQSAEGMRFAWSTDVYPHGMTTVLSIDQPKAAFIGSQPTYPTLLLADAAGQVWQVKDLTNDGKRPGNNGSPIEWAVATAESNGGDSRSDQLWGDQYVDVLAPFGMNATPIVGGNAIVAPTNIAANNNRQFVPVSVGGASLQNFLGMRLLGTDNFANATQPSTLYVWQPSFIDKPETSTDRFGDYKIFGKATYIRGVTIHGDTFAANKTIAIRNTDNNSLVPILGGPANSVINHAGEQEISYWFPAPFVSHMVRDEPQDLVPWRRFSVEYIGDTWPELTDLPSPWMNVRDTGQAGFLQGFVVPLETGNSNPPLLKLKTDPNGDLITLTAHTNPAFNVKSGVAYSLDSAVVCHQVQIIPQSPCRVWWPEISWKVQETPEQATTWESQWLGMGNRGLKGYYSIPRIQFVYTAAAAVTVVIQVYDGTAPVNITLPATGGEQRSVLVTLTFNKGLLYKFKANSTGVFQLFYEDTTLWVCEWGRTGGALPFHLGQQYGDKVPI